MISEIQPLPVTGVDVTSASGERAKLAPEFGPQGGSHAPGANVHTIRAKAWAKLVLALLVAGVLLVLMLSNWMHRGLPMIALAYLRGERLIIDPSVASLQVARMGEERSISFRVLNFTGRPVNLVGGTSNCVCVTIKDLPLEVPVGGSQSFAVTVRVGDKALNESASLITDFPAKPRLFFRVTGNVRK